MKTSYLSRSERETGLKRFLKGAFFNGLAYTFVGDTTVSLMAIHFGATNTQLGYISSVFFVAGFSILVVPAFLGGVSVIRAFYWAWMMRGLVCVLYGLVLFLPPQYAIFNILLVYTLFCIFRTVGVMLLAPVQRALCSSQNIGEVVSRVTVSAGVAIIVARTVSAGVLSLPSESELYGLLAILCLGVVFNTMGAGNMKHLPCRDTIDREPGRSIFRVFVENIRVPDRAIVLMLEWGKIPLAVLFGFMVPYLKRELGYSDSLVFVYTILTAISLVLAGEFLKPCSDRLGSKPMLIVSHFLLAGLAAVICFLPQGTPMVAVFVVGFATAFVLGTIMLLVARLILRSIPDNAKIGYTSMYSFFDAIAALIAGVAGGYLADLGSVVLVPSGHIYSWVFIALTVVALFNGFLCTRLNDPGSVTVRETLTILSSARNLRSFLDIYLLDTVSDRSRRESVLLSLESSDTTLASQEIRYQLQKPEPGQKERLLKSLYLYPRPELADVIIAESLDSNSYNREHAVFTLGAYAGDEVVAALQKSYDDDDPIIASIAAKSLARVGGAEIKASVQQRMISVRQPVCQLNYVAALSIMDRGGRYLPDILSLPQPAKGRRFNQTIYSTCSLYLSLQPPLSGFLHQENIERCRGFAALLEETRDLADFLDAHDKLNYWFTVGAHDSIDRWCRELISTMDLPDDRHRHLRDAVVGRAAEELDDDSSLASVYFAYMIATAAD